MLYNSVADSIHTKKLCSRLCSALILLRLWRYKSCTYLLTPSEAHFLTENGHFAFLGPFWGLGATYAVHIRLIELFR